MIDVLANSSVLWCCEATQQLPGQCAKLKAKASITVGHFAIVGQLPQRREGRLHHLRGRGSVWAGSAMAAPLSHIRLSTDQHLSVLRGDLRRQHQPGWNIADPHLGEILRPRHAAVLGQQRELPADLRCKVTRERRVAS